MRLKFSPFVALSFLVFGCGGDDAKSTETRIIAEINQMAEASRLRLHTPEIRASMQRMAELRPLFPDNREELVTEAKAIRGLASNLVEDNEKLNRKWEELLTLPLNDDYRKCAAVQIQSSSASAARWKLVIDEMDLFLDRTIIDQKTLELSLNPIRARQEAAELQDQQVETEAASKCRRPS